MTQTTLSLAKTTQPTLSMVLNRERLFDKLDSNNDKRAVWITGPPGAGKTTLSASYIKETGKKTLWYHLDSSDTDIATFFFYLRQSAIKHSKNADHIIPQLPVGVSDWVAFGCRLFRAIFSRFNEPLIIVFDNYEVIPPHSELHRIFANIIDEVPAHSRLFFTGRIEPGSPFARVRANGDLLLIDGDDLKLTSNENIQLAKIRDVKSSKEALKTIHQASAGWITGVILMMEYTRQSRQTGQVAYAESGSILYDYVAEEIFTGFDKSTKEFLLKVCWCRRLSIALAEKISEDKNARLMLVNLSRNNYFVTERDDSSECEYILHPLLREFLQEQSHKLFKEREIVALQNNTAMMLAEEGQLEEAVEVLVTNLSWEPMELIISQYAGLLIKQGRTSLLVNWLKELPRDRLNCNGWLLYWFGKARQIHSARESRQSFEQAFRVFRISDTPDMLGKVLACCGVIEAIMYEMDDYTLLDQWISELSGLLQIDSTSQVETDYIYANIILSIAEILRHPAQDVLSRCHQAEKKLKGHFSIDQKQYAIWLILAYQLVGEFDYADNLLDWINNNQGKKNTTLGDYEFHLLQSLNHIFTGKGAEGLNLVSQCESLLAESSPPEITSFFCACGAMAAISQGDMSTADKYLDRFGGGGFIHQRLIRFIHQYLSSWRAFCAGDVLKAHHLQRQAQVFAIELGIPFLEVLSSSAYAQLLFLCKDKRNGTAQLRRIHSIAGDICNPLLEFMTLLIFAEVEMQEDRISSGINAMRYALGLGRKHGYYQLPWWKPQQLADICVLALYHKIEVEYVRDLIIRQKLQPVQPPIDISEWPWPLRINTFAGINITQSGNTYGDPEKSKGRPLNLLGVLIALGGKDVSAQDVADVIWPHVDTDYSNKSLTINLHRLRRLLGNDDAVLLRDGQLSINDSIVWLDRWALDSMSSKIDYIAKRTGNVIDLTDVNNMAERLLTIYKGPFLPENKKTEIIDKTRTTCRKQFVSAIKLLAVTMHAAGASRDAIELYEKAIQQDPAADELYSQVIILFQQLERNEEVIAVFEKHCDVLGVTPAQSPLDNARLIYETVLKQTPSTNN